ncbi:MAG: 3-phosphoshikimate 1-carboxyvinyltransferase [Clostridiales bacterium]|nr:3-phosphoshikimate 1-carboxyvinyltransferase [Clostridiales bacterium]
MQKRIRPVREFNKTLAAPPDKSITHRAFMLGAVADGDTRIYNALNSDDCKSTLDCIVRCGARVTENGGVYTVRGGGKFSDAELYAGNSGTTTRLLTGILAAQNGGVFTLTGDASVCKRPMDRVTEPLSLMGADITSRESFCPLKIVGRPLSGIDYVMPVASAQVKSAVLLAGLFADSPTRITEKTPSRDHTEKMLAGMGADIKIGMTADGYGSINLKPGRLSGTDIYVPSDISSAAFPLVLALCKKGASVTVKNVGINPTRTGILDVFTACGAQITTCGERETAGERSADITASGGRALSPFCIDGAMIPRLIDEIPVLAVMACFIEGRSEIRGASELKIKESNRIDATAEFLTALGADVDTLEDGMIINGKGFLKGGATVDARGDHRVAMSAAVAMALSREGGIIGGAECVSVSYPGFFDILL